MKIALADIAGQEAIPNLAAMQCYLEAETVQAGAAGPVVGLGLVNGAGREIALLNPFVLVQFELLDDAGFPLPLPVRPPPMFIHTAGGEDWSLDGPLPTVGVRRNGTPVDRGFVEGRVLLMAAQEDWRVDFQLVLEGGGAKPDAADATATPAGAGFGDGTFTVGAVATLIDADRPNLSRVLQGGGLTVRLSRP